MQAIILAAGRGSRLGSMTDHKPKPLTPLAGKPLLEWQIQALTTAGIEQIHVVCGYCSEALTEYGDSRIYNPRWASSNMVRSLLCAAPLLSSAPALVCYGDIVYRPDIIRQLMAVNAPLAISYDQAWWSLWEARFDNPLLDAESFQQRDGKLITIGERVQSRDDIEGQYMGLLKFTPQAWKNIETILNSLTADAIDKLDMTSLLRLLLAHHVEITTVAINGGWVEVDNPADIALYEQKVAQSQWSHDWRYDEV